MRLRNIKGSKEVIAASPYVVQNPEDYKGKWSELFHNNHPLHIEIGMGKGQFIHTLASENPDINYIGIEMYSSVLYRALEKQTAEEKPIRIIIRPKFIFFHFHITHPSREIKRPWPRSPNMSPNRRV